MENRPCLAGAGGKQLQKSFLPEEHTKIFYVNYKTNACLVEKQNMWTSTIIRLTRMYIHDEQGITNTE